MDSLFSCRNCIQDCGQTINLGPGAGFCLMHNSVVREPDDTTCKYLHRKDLPRFTVDEGIREHASEFAFHSAMASLSAGKPIQVLRYSEKFCWEKGQFSPLMHALAQYHKVNPSWGVIQSFSGGVDGLRSVAHTALARRYLDTCGNWRSSYRIFLALLQEVDVTPRFGEYDLVVPEGEHREEVEQEALWDVVFSRLAGLQEYGWHAGIEDLSWITDSLNGSLASFDWKALRVDLIRLRETWTDGLIRHAKDNGAFFPEQEALDGSH